MTEGKIDRWNKGRRIKKSLPFPPDYFFYEYPFEHSLKLKGVQGTEPPGRGLGAEAPDGGVRGAASPGR